MSRCASHGVRALLTLPESQPKIGKGLALRIRTAVVHLSPADTADPRSVCPWSTAACRAACINWAGRGGIGVAADGSGAERNTVQLARMARTRLFWSDRAEFIRMLRSEVSRFATACDRMGMVSALRPNGTSDLPWETIAPDILGSVAMSYDYTKGKARALRSAAADRGDDAEWPATYRLTWSASEQDTEQDILQMMQQGCGAAVPFHADAHAEMLLRGSWRGFRVVDGDTHDVRPIDRDQNGIPQGEGYICALRAKGSRGKRDASGFVRGVLS